MKRLFLILFLISGVTVFLVTAQRNNGVYSEVTLVSPSPAVLALPTAQLTSSWAGPFRGENVSLINNLEGKKTASEANLEYQCRFLINAGFYTKEHKPVGLFIADGQVLRPQTESMLFDGFVTINQFRVPRITQTLPTDPLIHALQTGPLLVENGRELRLSIRNDREARRMVALTTGENEIYFVTFLDSDSFFRGPLLAELPELLVDEAQSKNIIIADAINLDGGSASAYISESLQLTELSPVGSFFCVK